jgi:hypothetical protein
MGELIEEALGDLEGVPGHEQLGQAIMHAGAMALVYRRLLDELPVESEWSFTEARGKGYGQPVRWVSVTGTGAVGPNSSGELTIHPYEAAFQRWTKLHADLLKTAHSIGMDERRQAFAERQVTAIGDAIVKLVEGLGHELDDPEVVPVVEATLRMISATAA